MGLVIAIDGPAGAGKSTVARGLADELGATYLDSGAMYRCVALAALRAGADLDDGVALGRIAVEAEITLTPEAVILDGEDVTEEIRAPEVSVAASRVSVHPEVRAAMVARQRALVANGDWVAEGRDIGTVVVPDASVKIFLTADPGERARRRAAELGADPAVVLQEQTLRDEQDIQREHSPLRPAPGAVEVDTTGKSIDEVVEEIAQLVREAR